MLSDEAINRYVESQGNHCPYCGSKDIQSDDIDWNTPLGITIECGSCERTWIDIMEVVGISEILD